MQKARDSPSYKTLNRIILVVKAVFMEAKEKSKGKDDDDEDAEMEQAACRFSACWTSRVSTSPLCAGCPCAKRNPWRSAPDGRYGRPSDGRPSDGRPTDGRSLTLTNNAILK